MPRPRSTEALILLSEGVPSYLRNRLFKDKDIAERNDYIRQEHEAGIGYATIGKRYGLSATRVKAIINDVPSHLQKVQSSRSKRKGRTLPILNGSSVDEFRQLLAEANISQKMLARHLGFSEMQVNNWAVGRAVTPMHVVRYLQLYIYMQKQTKLVRSLRLEDKGKFDD